MPTAQVRWVEGMQFVGMDSGGHSVVLSGDDQQYVGYRVNVGSRVQQQQLGIVCKHGRSAADREQRTGTHP